MNLAQLNAQACAIRQEPVSTDTRAQLDALRESADPGALAAFDNALRSLFADVYGGKAPPPLSVTSSGPASQVNFARLLRDHAVTLLRQQENR